jgi:hypothetical protein
MKRHLHCRGEDYLHVTVHHGQKNCRNQACKPFSIAGKEVWATFPLASREQTDDKRDAVLLNVYTFTG